MDVSQSAKESFGLLRERLVRKEERIKELHLEEVAIVPQTDVATMHSGTCGGATCVDDEDGLLDVPLASHLDSQSGGIIYRVVHRPAVAPRQEVRSDEDGDGGGTSGGGAGGSDGGGGGGGAGGGGRQLMDAFALMKQAAAPQHLPEMLQQTKEGKPVALGFPSKDLAFNHAVACVRAFGWGFSRAEVRVCVFCWFGMGGWATVSSTPRPPQSYNDDRSKTWRWA